MCHELDQSQILITFNCKHCSQQLRLVEAQDYSVQPLEIGFASGQDRLLLWLPMTMTHVIDETSPLSNWKIPEDALQDADATIVILVHV